MNDVFTALASFRSRSGVYRFNPGRVVAVGFSSGGHLAQLLATVGRGRDRLAAWPPSPASATPAGLFRHRASGGCRAYPGCPPAGLAKVFSDVANGATPVNNPRLYRRCRPVDHVTLGCPPMLLIGAPPRSSRRARSPNSRRRQGGGRAGQRRAGSRGPARPGAHARGNTGPASLAERVRGLTSGKARGFHGRSAIKPGASSDGRTPTGFRGLNRRITHNSGWGRTPHPESGTGQPFAGRPRSAADSGVGSAAAAGAGVSARGRPPSRWTRSALGEGRPRARRDHAVR